MGTRAGWGLRLNGKLKDTYVHYDGYPTWLGYKVVEIIEKVSDKCELDTRDKDYDVSMKNELEIIFNRITMLGFDDVATDEQVKKYIHLSDFEYSTNDFRSFYLLLKKVQTEPSLYVTTKLDVMYPNNGDNEWFYVIDIDNFCLEVTKNWSNEVIKIPLSKDVEYIKNYLYDIEND